MDYRYPVLSKSKHTTKRVTLAHIAEACDVSRVTVSKALRDDPKISVKTRNRVKAAAKKLGYVPDSRLSELMTYLGSERRVSGIHEEIPYVYFGDYQGDTMAQPGFFAEAKAFAADQGFRLEPYHLTHQNYAAIERRFHARSVRGLLFAPFASQEEIPPINWEQYSLMGFGLSQPDFKVPRVDWNYRLGVRGTIERMRALGYKRIGVVASVDYSAGLNYAVEAETWTHYHRTEKSEQVKPLFDNGIRMDDTAEPVLRRWVAEERPDVVLCTEPNYQRMLRLGLLDERVGFATWWIPGETKDTEMAGMQGDLSTLAELGMKTLIGMVRSQQRGLVKNRTLTLVDMNWREGSTAPGYGKARP